MAERDGGRKLKFDRRSDMHHDGSLDGSVSGIVGISVIRQRTQRTGYDRVGVEPYNGAV